jgi:hypothetical protein
MTIHMAPDSKDRHVSLLDADPQNRPFLNSTRTINMGVCISINKIDKELRPAAEMRAELNAEAIQAYSENIESMPPVKLVHDRPVGIYWVRDGAHTISAAKSLGLTEIRAQVEEGDYLGAWKLASRENGSHGVRLTNADKRSRVERALKSCVMRDMSNRQIAELCGVSSTFVDNLYRKLADGASCPDSQVQTVCTSDSNSQLPTVGTSNARKVGRDGKSYPATQPTRTPTSTGEIPHVETPQVQTVCTSVSNPQLQTVASSTHERDQEERDLIVEFKLSTECLRDAGPLLKHFPVIAQAVREKYPVGCDVEPGVYIVTEGERCEISVTDYDIVRDLVDKYFPYDPDGDISRQNFGRQPESIDRARKDGFIPILWLVIEEGTPPFSFVQVRDPRNDHPNSVWKYGQRASA